ncbi:Acyl-homoserine lactone (AHL) acylase PvdQ [Rheinheimera pacifica]|uniref:Acyl-homoserine lactone (AHL) acylase PvdQ n=1 Tax=Rheinheimera pacifica TaxID=173990 RepID=A0A1H6MU87_9GAMM|nr:penicillin acylase family protein [Rheinheimera pacifica]SEI05625.1 Acyl-homoserine lactone (AHL) acylase PvdQ [Rheinheimera pacifica]
MSLIIIPVAVMLVLVRLYLGTSLPQSDYYKGEFKAYPELSIQRDAQGVPLISGDELIGIYYGLGVAHAQDRLWQMELLRRKAAGRLSEVYGAQKLHIDKFARTMGFYNQATKDLAAMSDSTLAILNAYSNGVNYWLAHAQQLPLEFSVSAIKPQPWSPLDTLAIFKVYAFELNASFHKDYERLQLLQLFGIDYQSSLFAGNSEIDIDFSSQLLFTPLKSKSLASVTELQKDFNFGGAFTAIEGIVTSPQLLQKDKAYLAYTLLSATEYSATPYYARLNAESHKLAGVTLPGVPAVMFGENGSISWVGSPALADTQDLIVEQFNPAKQGEYLYGGKWLTVDYRVEAIKVRANFPSFLRNPIQDVQLTVKSTNNGPLLSELLDTDLPVSLVWTGFNDADTSYESILKLSHAENWSAFVEASAGVVAPAMNFLYIDSEGNIGMQASGKVPVRHSGEGKLPIQAGSTNSSWTSFVAPQNMTSLINPEKGWLTFTSGKSNSVARVASKQSYALSLDALSLNELHSILSEVGRNDNKTLLPLLLDLVTENSERKTVLARLRDEMSSQQSSTVPQVIYAAWLTHYRKLLVLDAFEDNKILRVSDQHASQWGAALSVDYLQQKLEATASRCRADASETGTQCASIVEQALDSAIGEISLLAGRDINNWTLDNLQHGEFAHSIFGQTNILKSVLNQPIQLEPSITVLKPELNQYKFGKGIVTKQTPAMKVIHHGEENISTSLLLLRGQSSNMFSPWYEHQSPLADDWVNR